jgi:hypothetical protein
MILAGIELLVTAFGFTGSRNGHIMMNSRLESAEPWSQVYIFADEIPLLKLSIIWSRVRAVAKIQRGSLNR